MIIPGFTDYDISEDGIVTKVSTGKVVKPNIVRLGMYAYKNVRIVDDSGLGRAKNVMRLLAMTYLPKPDAHSMARAKDGDNTNTILSNVEWVPYCDRAKEHWRNGKMAERRARRSSVTEDLIDLVYDTMCLYDKPVTMTSLSNELEMPYSAVRYSMIALVQRGKARKLREGFEAIQ
jgi:hypothetical protein